MWMNRLNNLIRCQFAAHSNRKLADQIGRIRSNDMRAQNFIILPNDDLCEPIRLGNCNGFPDSSPGEALNAYFGIFLSRLFLGQTNPGNFGESENWVGHNVV